MANNFNIENPPAGANPDDIAELEKHLEATNTLLDRLNVAHVIARGGGDPPKPTIVAVRTADPAK